MNITLWKRFAPATAVALMLSVGLWSGSTPAQADTEAHEGRASIPFARMGSIRNWRADGSRGLYVQGPHRQWYYAEFFGSCHGASFSDQIAFVTEPGTGALDRWSSIIVNGERCHFRSFEEVEGPPKKR